MKEHITTGHVEADMLGQVLYMVIHKRQNRKYDMRKAHKNLSEEEF